MAASSRDVCLRCQVAATMLDAGAFNRIFVRVQPRCLPAVSGGRGLVGCDRYVVVTVFGRDVCLNCQVAATMFDAGAMIRFFVRV